jgi:hypothetical protein
MNEFSRIGVVILMAVATLQAQAAGRFDNDQPLVVTNSNATNNQLLIYNANGSLLKAIATNGHGGMGGNAGGIAASHDRVAVVNYGSGDVSLFIRDFGWERFHLVQVLKTVDKPVSVAFGSHHLYVLTATHVESHTLTWVGAVAAADGVSLLVKADGSAAQVGVLSGQLIISEKSNAIETVDLANDGRVAGVATLVANIPANVDAPFGLAARGNNAYVTIAHADEISLVRNNAVLTTVGSGTEHAPCWAALAGPYLFTANTPSKSVSRYVVYGQKIIQEQAVVAHFSGGPTDIAYNGSLMAVIDSDGNVAHLSTFAVDDDGNVALRGMATINAAQANGVAIVDSDDFDS